MTSLSRYSVFALLLVIAAAVAKHHAVVLWTANIPRVQYCTTDSNNFVGCATSANQSHSVASISPINGTVLWQVASPLSGAVEGLQLQFCPQRPDDAFLISFSASTAALSSVSKSTGRVHWTATITATVESNGTTPTIQCSNDGLLVYLLTATTLSTFEASTGAARWSRNVQGAQGYNLLEVPDNRANATSLVFIDEEGVHRLDARTAIPLPFYSMMSANDTLLGIVGHLVIIQKANTSVLATTADGHMVWWWLVGFMPSLSLVQLRRDVLVFGATNANEVEALNATTGKRLWSRPLGAIAPTLGAITDDLIVLAIGPVLVNTSLYAFASWEAVSLTTGLLQWAQYNLTTSCLNTFATTNYFGVVSDDGNAIAAYKIIDGTHHEFPLVAACDNEGLTLAVFETAVSLLVQNDTNTVAYGKA